MEPHIQIECLQEAIYFESRSESLVGQLAVGLVIMNRVRDKRWPNNTCGVVHQKWQFSYYWDGQPEIYKDGKAKQRAGLVSEMVFYGTQLDFTEGSVYYFATRILPSWDFSKIERVATIDEHVFYRDIK